MRLGVSSETHKTRREIGASDDVVLTCSAKQGDIAA
jgi:hypothetical protein